MMYVLKAMSYSVKLRGTYYTGILITTFKKKIDKFSVTLNTWNHRYVLWVAVICGSYVNKPGIREGLVPGLTSNKGLYKKRA